MKVCLHFDNADTRKIRETVFTFWQMDSKFLTSHRKFPKSCSQSEKSTPIFNLTEFSPAKKKIKFSNLRKFVYILAICKATQIFVHFDGISGISFLNFVNFRKSKVGLPSKEEIPNALENSPPLGHFTMTFRNPDSKALNWKSTQWQTILEILIFLPNSNKIRSFWNNWRNQRVFCVLIFEQLNYWVVE